MILERIAKGSWSYKPDKSVTAHAIKIILYARDKDGNPCSEPGPELLAAAEAAKLHASRLKNEFLQQIGFPDRDEVISNGTYPVTGFTQEQLLNPSDEVLHSLHNRLRLLHICVEQFPHGLIETRGYVVDAWDRVWEVGDDYIEGCWPLDEPTA